MSRLRGGLPSSRKGDSACRKLSPGLFDCFRLVPHLANSCWAPARSWRSAAYERSTQSSVSRPRDIADPANQPRCVSQKHAQTGSARQWHHGERMRRHDAEKAMAQGRRKLVANRSGEQDRATSRPLISGNWPENQRLNGKVLRRSSAWLGPV